jgi:hypothetical protein
VVPGSFPVAGRPAPGLLPPHDLGIVVFMIGYYSIQACRKQAQPEGAGHVDGLLTNRKG